MDQPTADGLNTYLVSKCAHDAGLKVALSGLGGDELFAGYPSFRRITRAARWLSWVPRGAERIAAVAARGRDGRVGKLEALGMRGDCVERLYFADRGLFMPSKARRLMSDGLASRVAQALVGADRDAFALGRPEDVATGPDTPHLTMLLELRRYMKNQLLRESDVFGMANSTEIRVPLIDHVVAEILFRTDPGIITQGTAKNLLLEALPSPLPRACTDRPKMGFTLPFDRWMRGPWRQAIERTLLASDRVLGDEEPLFNRSAIEHLWRAFLAGRTHWSRPWSVFVLKRKLHSTIRPVAAPKDLVDWEAQRVKNAGQ
jgi:asparagine synthase (glutamine-hydrolysing)